VPGKKKKKESAEGLAIAPTAKEREQIILDILNETEKTFGPESIATLGGKFGRRGKVSGVVPTGSLGLDAALGIGGLPRGRVVETFGPEMSGKTTITLHAIAEVQAMGGIAAFIDAEHALDPTYAGNLGVKVSELLISQPDSGEQALDIARTLVNSGKVDLVAIDSVAALVPKCELEGDIGDSAPGAQARMMSKTLRVLTADIYKTNTIVIFINQLRHKIGVMFGSPETTSGGNALKFYASVRLDIRRIGAVKKGDEKHGNRTRVTVVKNKLAPPFKKTEFDIIYGKGIDRMGELIDAGTAAGLIRRAGSWYSLGDNRIGQGRISAIRFLSENPKMAGDLRKEIKNAKT
jgi:recombination protein RecA